MDFHEIANMFPLLDDTELDALAEDIQVNGLQEPIWLYEGKILDGRNRYLACKLAGVEPCYQEYTRDEPVQFVISKNIQRRHMTPWQRAFVALEALPAYQEEAKKRMLAGVRPDPSKNFYQGRATDIVGRMFSTNTMYINAAARLKVSHPEYVEAAQTGEYTYADFIKLKHDERANLQQVRDELAPSEYTTVSEELSNDTHAFC